MMTLNRIFRKSTGRYKLTNLLEKINHLVYLKDKKLFTKNEKELETPIQLVRIYSQDIGMVFGSEKCTMLIIRNRKQHMSEVIELLNKEKVRTLIEKETYKYLGIIETDTIKQEDMKKLQKDYLRRTKKKTTRK